MAKHGPRPRPGERYPCGKLRPTNDGPTDEQKERRHALVGTDDRKQRYASYALGVLYVRDPKPGEKRDISSAQHYTGLRYAALFKRAVRPLVLPSILGNLVASGGFQVAMAALDQMSDGERGAADRSDYLAARQALGRHGAAVAMAVDDLVIYDHVPRTTQRLEKIREGLDLLHDYFDEVDRRAGAARPH